VRKRGIKQKGKWKMKMREGEKIRKLDSPM
jgi:hypothetical protein